MSAFRLIVWESVIPLERSFENLVLEDQVFILRLYSERLILKIYLAQIKLDWFELVFNGLTWFNSDWCHFSWTRLNGPFCNRTCSGSIFNFLELFSSYFLTCFNRTTLIWFYLAQNKCTWFELIWHDLLDLGFTSSKYLQVLKNETTGQDLRFPRAKILIKLRNTELFYFLYHANCLLLQLGFN